MATSCSARSIFSVTASPDRGKLKAIPPRLGGGLRRNSCFRGWIAEAWQAPRLETEQSGEHFLLLIQIRPPCCSSAVKVKARTFAQREPRGLLFLRPK